MGKTALQWFASQIIGGKLITNQKFKELLEQAKEIEKEQMDKISEDWWVEGCAYMKDGKRIYESFEQYYNQTFKKD